MGTADAAVLSAASGSPTVVVVEGAEGTGKSSFLDELADRAVGFDVLDAGGFESAAEHPFGILEQWGAINGMGSPPPASPFVGAKLLHELLDRHADNGPVLLRLDDLHWADRESVEALTWMLQRASGDRLLVGIASRPLASTEHPAWQRWSSGRGRVLPVPLTGLTLENATRLLRDVRPDLNPATARRLWEHTDGNPSYLAALLAEYDGADLASRRWLPAPRAFAEAIDSQSRRLSGDALALVRAVAVLGTDWCSLADAGALASVEHPTDAAHELVEQGLLRMRVPDAGAAVRVAQPILHSAIYEQIPPAERRTLHGAAAGIVPRTDDVLGHRIAAVEQYDDALAAEIDAWASYLHEVSLHRLAARHLRAAAWLSSVPRDRERRWLDSLFESLLAQDTGVVRAVEHKVEDAEDVVRRDLVLGALATFEDDNHEAVYWFGKQLDDDETAPTADPLTHYRIEVLLAWARIQGGADTGLVAAGLARADGLAARDPALLGLARRGRWPGGEAHPSGPRPARRAGRPTREPGGRPLGGAQRARLAGRPPGRRRVGGAGDRRPRARRLDGRRGWARGRTSAPARPPGPVPLVRRAVEQGAPAPAPGPRPRRERVTDRGRDRAAARHRHG